MSPNNHRLDRRYCMRDPLADLTDEQIVSRIPYGSRVLDLGCGDGRLLNLLHDTHGCSVQGIDVDMDAMAAALARGVPVIQNDLDRGLAGFPDHSFDFAVLSQTLQQVLQPRVILHEMLRVARQALIVVPNFGYWRIRLQILYNGRAPVTSALPYEWYDTPNLHFMTMNDFKDLVEVVKGRIVEELPMIEGRTLRNMWMSNLRADGALYLVERKADA